MKKLQIQHLIGMDDKFRMTPAPSEIVQRANYCQIDASNIRKRHPERKKFKGETAILYTYDIGRVWIAIL